MTTTTAIPAGTILSDGLIEACGDRASAYDRENRFFEEDWAALRAAGFLTANVPAELGGGGLNLSQTCMELRRLARRAPATALATNMHLFWTMTAADMRRFGDNSLDWVLHEAVAGEVFASGHSERGNDVPVLLSTSSAERVDGGYRFTGHKIFGSLSPVWTRLGIHAMDAGDAEGPQIVHAFLPRDTPGITIKQTWDTLGMRATQSQDTILDGAFVPDRYIARRLPAGTADLYVLCMSVAALGGIASVYLGIAHRALELAVASAHQRTSIALSRSMAYHPGVQHEIAEMALRLEAMDAQLERVVSDWDEGVDYGDLWALKIAAAKHNVCEGAKDVVDRAMTISGGGGLFRSNELERLYRDVRAGGFHPENPLLVHETIGKAVLGIDPNEEPRWG